MKVKKPKKKLGDLDGLVQDICKVACGHMRVWIATKSGFPTYDKHRKGLSMVWRKAQETMKIPDEQQIPYLNNYGDVVSDICAFKPRLIASASQIMQRISQIRGEVKTQARVAAAGVYGLVKSANPNDITRNREIVRTLLTDNAFLYKVGCFSYSNLLTTATYVWIGARQLRMGCVPESSNLQDYIRGLVQGGLFGRCCFPWVLQARAQAATYGTRYHRGIVLVPLVVLGKH